MWTFFRGKSRAGGVLPVTVAALALALGSGCATHPPHQESLYTPVGEGWAVGPVPPPPVPYYPYQPRAVRSLNELPTPVRAAAEAHVRARVGEAFYRQLRFAGGEAVDLAALRRVNPASRNFRPPAAAFVLRWDFLLPAAGLRRYTATLALGADGGILREIDLPACAADPAKLQLRPLRGVAADLARRGLIDPAAATVSAAYDPARDTLLWHFEQTLPGPGPEVNVRTLDADARTGEPLRS